MQILRTITTSFIATPLDAFSIVVGSQAHATQSSVLAR